MKYGTVHCAGSVVKDTYLTIYADYKEFPLDTIQSTFTSIYALSFDVGTEVAYLVLS